MKLSGILLDAFTCVSELQASTIVSYESLLPNVVICVHLTIELYSLCKSAKFFVLCAIPRALDIELSKCHHCFGIGVFHLFCVCIEISQMVTHATQEPPYCRKT